MSNLKKVLSVGLASTMVMGMMTTAGAASYEKFTDKADIEHKDAVSMVSELGIIAGLTNGTYAPKQNIDRASFARLVCVALNGGKEPNLGNLKTSFTDTQGHWAEKYIAYCVDRGIIAGRGDGTFAPSANVTGSEAAKMLLVALGYNTKYEGIGGATWQTTTDVLANLAGLYDDLESMNTSAPLTRDNAAQMIYNALDADTVTYSWTYNANGTSVAVQNKTGMTMLEDKFNAIKVEGVVTANEFSDLNSSSEKGSSKDEGKTVIDVTNYGSDEDQKVFNDGTYSVSTGKDELGKSITLYVKNDSGNSSKATVLGSAVLSEDNKIVTSAANKNVDKLADDNDLDIVAGTKVVYNYGGAKAWSELSAAEKAGIGAVKPNRGTTKTLIDNDDDGDVDYILLEDQFFGKVSKYSTKDDGSITIDIGSAWNNKNLTADDKKDVVGFDDVKKDDYVLAAWIGGDLHVAKAESVTGKLESYKKGETLTVAGTKYDVSQIAGYTGGDDDIEAAANVDNAYLDTEATFYLDQNGMVVAVGDATENGGNYAYVWAGSNNSNNGIDSNRVKVTLQDGTTKTYDLDGDTDKDIKAAVKKLAVGNADHSDALARVYAYSIGSDGEIKLSDAKGGNGTSGTVAFEKNKTYVGNLLDANGASKTKYASSSTVFFYVSIKDNEIDDVDVYTGYASAPSVDNVKAYAAYNNGNNMAAVAFTGGSITGKDVADHLFVTDILGHNQDNTTTIKAILAGSDKETEIKVDESNFNVETNKDETGLYLYTVNTDGTYKLTAAKNAGSKDILTPSGVEKISSKTIAIADDAEYKLTSKTVVVEIDGKNFDDFDNAYVGSLPSNNDRALVREVLVNGDDEVLMIVKGLDSSSTPVAPSESGYTANVKDVNGTLTLTKYVGDTYSKSEIISMIKAGLDDVKSVTANADGTYTVTFNDGNVITYNFTTVDMCKVVSDGAITFVKRGSTVETKNDADVKTAIATTVNKAVSYSLVSATSYTVNANETVLVTVYKMDIATHSLTSAVSGYKTADGAALTPAKGSAGNVWLAEGDTATVKSTANNTITVSGAKSTWSTKSTEGEIFTMPAETVTAETAPTPVAVAVTLSGVIDGKFTADSNTFAVTMTGAEGAKSGDVVTVTVKSTNVVSGNTTLKLTATNGSAIRPSTITFENGTEGKEYKFEVTLAQSTSTETLTLAKN